MTYNGFEFFYGSNEGQSVRSRVGVSHKTGLFYCHCGCGQSFFGTFKTRHPKYANRTHKARAERARARARIEVMELISEGCIAYEFYQQWYEAILDGLLAQNYGRK